MNALRIGSLFSGYGGLDMAVAAHYGATVAWHVEFDKHPSAILAAHWPDIPNHGDVTAVDWSAVEPVDIITGGFPCQDVSHAGLRAGVHQGTRSGLWFEMARAIDALQPRKVVIENVAGLLSADAACNVEPCPWCVGDEPAGHMRALGAVLADLAEMGFDAEWGSVRASDAGAPHGRLRVFIVATDASGERPQGGQPSAGDGRPRGCDARVGAFAGDQGGAVGGDPDGLTLLPTPACNDMGRGKTPEVWDEWTDAMRAKHGNGNGHGKSLEIEAQRLLPTPKASDGPNGGPGMRNGRGVADALPGVVTQLLPTPTARDHKGADHANVSWENATKSRGDGGASSLPDVATLLPTPTAQAAKHGSTPDIHANGYGSNLWDLPHLDFGPYTAAIARWEQVLGRPAPPPTEPGQNGRPRLSPRFVEWMMGLPDGWVTGVNIPRSAQLKALGNGVVRQQAALALELLDPR